MLISSVFAEAAVNGASNPMSSIMPQVLITLGFLGLFYFLIWRPQAQRQKEKQALLNALQKGDVIYTNGGVVGRITQVLDSFYQIEVSANTRLYIQKEAILDLVPKGSLKALGFE